MAKRRSAPVAHDGPLRIVAYLRQSKARPGERRDTSLSLDAQEAKYRLDEAAHGWATVAVIRDHDLKGDDPARPGIRELFAACESGGVDGVWVFAISRFARDFLYQELTWRSLQDLGVSRLFSHTEPIIENRLTRGVLGLANQEQLDQIGAFISAAVAARARRGEWHGTAPYGLRRPNEIPYTDKEGAAKVRRSGPIAPDPAEEPWVRRIVERFLAGASLWGIADELNALGVPARKKGHWDAHMVRHVLTNPAIAGDVALLGEVVCRDAHPAIVDRPTWGAVQARIAVLSRVRRKRDEVGSWAEGLVEHACGQRMYLYGINRHVATRPPIPSFGCRTAYGQTARKCGLPRRHLVVSKLETAVRACLVADLAGAIPVAEALARGRAAAGGDETEHARRALEDRRKVAQKRYERVREGWLASDRGHEWLAEETAKFTADLAAIDAELAALPAPPDPAAYARIGAQFASVAPVLRHLPGGELRRVLEEVGVAVVSEAGVTIRYHPGYRDFVPCPATIDPPPGRLSFEVG